MLCRAMSYPSKPREVYPTISLNLLQTTVTFSLLYITRFSGSFTMKKNAIKISNLIKYSGIAPPSRLINDTNKSRDQHTNCSIFFFLPTNNRSLKVSSFLLMVASPPKFSQVDVIFLFVVHDKGRTA